MNKTRVRTKGWLFDSMAFTLALASVFAMLAPAFSGQLPAAQPRQQTTDQFESRDSEVRNELLSIGPVPIETETETLVAIGAAKASGHFFRLPHNAEIAWSLLTLSAFLCGYSLITAGKKGVGWFTVSLIITVLAVVAKLVLSMFVEVTTQYSPPDWDED
jgi:ABC-type glycerol-3-phosphate transport system permease component